MSVHRRRSEDGMVVDLTQFPSPQREGDWISGTLVTGPAPGDVLVDTGTLEAGDYVFAFFMSTTQNSTIVRIEHRDAANAVTLRDQQFEMAKRAPIEPVIPTKLFIATDERMRVVNVLAPGTADVQASIMFARLVDHTEKQG